MASKYSNDYSQITQGLVTYLGAALSSLPDTFSADEKAHMLMGELAGQIVHFSKNDSGLSPYRIKPILRAIDYLVSEEMYNIPEESEPYKAYDKIHTGISEILRSISDGSKEE